jgi:hypothetical protein
LIGVHATADQVERLAALVTDIHYERQSFLGPLPSGASLSGGMASGMLYQIETAEEPGTFLLRTTACHVSTGWVSWELYLLDPEAGKLYTFTDAARGLRIPVKEAPAGGVWVACLQGEAYGLLHGLTMLRGALAPSPQDRR